MLAWELAAGASALEGGFVEVDLGAVRDFAAALAFAPERALVASESTPLHLAGVASWLPAFAEAASGASERM